MTKGKININIAMEYHIISVGVLVLYRYGVALIKTSDASSL